MISRFFIDRPVLANVLAILMIVIGAVSLLSLPVAQYPDVTPPTVQVQTRYPGAGARTIVDTVALPIEQQVNGVENMIYMQSMSTSDGTYTLVVTFKVGTDLNFAQILVQNRVSAALSALPDAVQKQGVTVQKQSTAILMFVTLTSPDNTFDSLYLANYGTIRLKDELARLPGVGSVLVFGSGQYSMRIWLDPEKLRARGLTTQDVTQALQQQSQQVAAGQIGAPPAPANTPFQYTVTVAGRLADVEQFEDVIVKTGNAGEVTRVRDIGRVELGAQSYGQIFNANGRPAAGIAVFQAPGANALNVEKTVRKRMDELAREFPKGLTADIPFNTTIFVDEAIKEVYKTLIEAALLVLFVILLFLQDWRAMLIPATTVPVTIIGAFAAMAALGFTVNLSTLFAIVLAIGIVVDDAIVIVEGVAHNIEQGATPHDASIKAMDELFGPIVGITLVLMSVFIPAAFMPGLTGQMYAQFALVIAATAILSAINAATLKPTQAALWMRPAKPPEQRNIIYRIFNRGYDALERGYVRLIDRMASHSVVSVIVGAGHRRACRLGADARAGRLHSDRGPGLPAGRRPAAGRRVAGADAEGHGADRRDRPQDAGRRSVRHHRRHLAARQLGLACQCRRRLRDAETVEPARQGAGPAVAVQQHEPGDAGGNRCARAGGPAAADPGHRQRVRLHHAAGTARRQLRLHQAADACQRRDGERRVRPACSVSRRLSAPMRRSSASTSIA